MWLEGNSMTAGNKLVMLAIFPLIIAAGFYYLAFRDVGSNISIKLPSLNTHAMEALQSVTKSEVNAEANKEEITRNTNEEAADLYIVHFWATWCGPCVEEYPSLVTLSEQHKQIRIYAVGLDNNLVDVKNFVRAFPAPGKNMRVLSDTEGNSSAEYGVSKIPESFVFNRKKEFVRKLSGSMNWQSSEMDRMINELLQK